MTKSKSFNLKVFGDSTSSRIENELKTIISRKVMNDFFNFVLNKPGSVWFR